MTNGEKIKQMFPNAEYTTDMCTCVNMRPLKDGEWASKFGWSFDIDWWNAEYEEPSDTKTIIISKGAAKHGNKDYVVYKRDWLMEHLDSEFEVLKGARNLKEKIAKAKPSTWLTDGLTDEEVEQIIDDGKEQARNCKRCKHRIPTVDIEKCKDTYGCELWECKFEPKER